MQTLGMSYCFFSTVSQSLVRAYKVTGKLMAPVAAKMAMNGPALRALPNPLKASISLCIHMTTFGTISFPHPQGGCRKPLTVICGFRTDSSKSLFPDYEER